MHPRPLYRDDDSVVWLPRGFAAWTVAGLVGFFAVGCDRPQTPVAQQPPQESILRVSAEDWSEFTLSQDPVKLGWVALPPVISEPGYRSSVDPQALGILPAEECAECHQGHTHGFLASAHARTARIADPTSVLGSLQSPENQVITGRKGFEFETFARDTQVIHRLKSEILSNVVFEPSRIRRRVGGCRRRRFCLRSAA